MLCQHNWRAENHSMMWMMQCRVLALPMHQKPLRLLSHMNMGYENWHWIHWEISQMTVGQSTRRKNKVIFLPHSISPSMKNPWEMMTGHLCFGLPCVSISWSSLTIQLWPCTKPLKPSSHTWWMRIPTLWSSTTTWASLKTGQSCQNQ